MILVLSILHVAIAAAWFGHKLLIPGDIRRTAHAGPSEAGALVARLRRAERFGIVTGLGTLLSGLALMWAVGFETVSLWIWMGLALVIVAIGIGGLVARPSSRRLREAVEQGDRVQATVESRQVGRVLGAESILWVGALATMLV
jgi:uncharacterized membrane protein